MTYRLNDNVWELRLNQTFSAQESKHFLGLFTNPFVMVKVTSETADTAWKKGGKIGQGIELSFNEIAYGNYQELTLNDISLFEFPIQIGTNYSLYYFPYLRLEQVKIKVWEYTGTTQDVLVERLITALENQTFTAQIPDLITTKLTTLEQKIEELMGLYSNTSSEISTSAYSQYTVAPSSGTKLLCNGNSNRKGLTINNENATGTIYLGFDEDTDDVNYFVAISSNQTYSFDTVYTGQVWGYLSEDNIAMKITEFGGDSFNQALLPN